jgi:thioredoxin reductase (NADPH)
VEDEAVGISFGEKLMVRTASGQSFPAEAIVLATGISRKVPKIDGLEKFEGSGISFCAVCDGFFSEAKMLLCWDQEYTQPMKQWNCCQSPSQ